MHLMPRTLILYYLINVTAKVVTSINQYVMKNYRTAYIYIYIYIYRERERERERAVRLPKCGILFDLNYKSY
jgi:hypothetical protein